jgi:hypothetical protein
MDFHDFIDFSKQVKEKKQEDREWEARIHGANKKTKNTKLENYKK